MAQVALRGKVALVTGATSGLGKVTALELARQGAQVVIVGRNPAKTAQTAAEIQDKAQTPAVHCLVGDLSVMSEVRRVADEFQQRHERLDMLINNVGAIFDQRQETAEGLEMTFAINHLSHFLFTNHLLGILKASPAARVVNVSSGIHLAARLAWDDLQSKRSYTLNGLGAYSLAKLLNVMFSHALARRLTGTSVTSNVLHPGAVATGFGRNLSGGMRLLVELARPFELTPERGADTILYLATSPDVEGVTGKYFAQRKQVLSSPASNQEANQRRMWDISADLIGL
jgi:NAD(P)-dependent dehydrogenase (short-subunit alcohol dehydrogenase family)